MNNCKCEYHPCIHTEMGTTPTTPSEWGQIKIDVDEVLYDLTDHTLTFDEASAMMLKIVKQLLHHNTEDIIEQCAKEAEEWLDDTEADETVKAILRVVAKQIRALKPTHKE